MPWPGHPAVSDVDMQNVNTLVLAVWNITIREVAKNVGLDHLTVLHILKKELQMQKIITKWFHMILTEQQKWL
jgi:hypothetical protein